MGGAGCFSTRRGAHPVQTHEDGKRRAEEGQGQPGRWDVGWESVTFELSEGSPAADRHLEG